MDIKDEFGKASLTLTDEQEKQLDIMAGFLQEYNEKVNLTAIRDREGIIKKHFVDSVLPLTLFDVKQNAVCADIGTGAGFPALPMMIYRPDLKFTLVDALQKRVTYLEQATARIGVSADLVHGRAEDMGRSPEFRDHFDMVTARAVSSLTELAEYCLPLLKRGGFFLAMRGSGKELDDHAVKIFRDMGGTVRGEIEYKLPDGDNRRLIIVEKTYNTPRSFPRSAAQMKKNPL